MPEPSRAELVERLIASERECRMMARTLREMCAHDDTNASYVLLLQARIVGLEANVAKLAKKRGDK